MRQCSYTYNYGGVGDGRPPFIVQDRSHVAQIPDVALRGVGGGVIVAHGVVVAAGVSAIVL